MLTETMIAIVQSYHTKGMRAPKIAAKLGLPIDEIHAAIAAAYPPSLNSEKEKKAVMELKKYIDSERKKNIS